MADNELTADVMDCNIAYLVVDEVIDDVVDLAAEVLHDNDILARVRELALDHVMNEIKVALTAVNVPHDIGEQGKAWVAEEEPECAPIDTWGRGAVPSKKKKQSFLSELRGMGSAPTQSVGSRARSRRSRGSKRSNRSRGNAQAETPARPTVIMATSSVPNARPSTLPKMLPNNATEQQNAEVNAMELLQQQEQERIEQLRKEQEEEDARYRALQNELKGKEYTFDADGNLIVISRISAEKTGGLSHLRAEDRFGIDASGPARGDIPAAVAAPDAGTSKRRGSGKSRKKSKRRTSSHGSPSTRTSKGKGKQDPAAHFEPDPTKQPPLLNTIRLVPGVTLKEGSSAKNGPPKKEDDLHMSRSDFQAHQSRLGLLSQGTSSCRADGFRYHTVAGVCCREPTVKKMIV